MAARRTRSFGICFSWYKQGSLIAALVMCLELLTISTTATTPATMLTFSDDTLTSDDVIRESVMIPSSDPEKEAQELYEKSLREYGVTEGRTLRKVCTIWETRRCHCTGNIDQVTLNCRGLEIVEIPQDIPLEVVNLDLGNNNITTLPAKSFDAAVNLEELSLADNRIKQIDADAFYGLKKLKRLSLQNCGLTVIPGESFSRILNLVSLQLNGNALASLDSTSIKYLQNLRTLRLEGNLFYRVPTDALSGLKTLEALNLGSNLLTIISEDY